MKDQAIASHLASSACLLKQINTGWKQELILHADNGNTKPQASRRIHAGMLKLRVGCTNLMERRASSWLEAVAAA